MAQPEGWRRAAYGGPRGLELGEDVVGLVALLLERQPDDVAVCRHGCKMSVRAAPWKSQRNRCVVNGLVPAAPVVAAVAAASAKTNEGVSFIVNV